MAIETLESIEVKIKSLRNDIRKLEKKASELKAIQIANSPHPTSRDGFPVVHESVYGEHIWPIIQGSGCSDDEYYNMTFMRGSKIVQKHKYSFSTTCTWGGYVVEVISRYLRRCYPDRIFFDRNELTEVMGKVTRKYWMASQTHKAVRERFIVRTNAFGRKGSVCVNGEIEYMEHDQYEVAKQLVAISDKYQKLESKYNEHN